LISFFIFHSPSVLVLGFLGLVFGFLIKLSTALFTRIMFYPLTHLLPLTLFQPNPTPMDFCLGRTSHVTRGISNQRATYARWDEFPKIQLGFLPASAKTEVMPAWIKNLLSLYFESYIAGQTVPNSDPKNFARIDFRHED